MMLKISSKIKLSEFKKIGDINNIPIIHDLAHEKQFTVAWQRRAVLFQLA